MSGRPLVIAALTSGSASELWWLACESHTSVIHSASGSVGSVAMT